MNTENKFSSGGIPTEATHTGGTTKQFSKFSPYPQSPPISPGNRSTTSGRDGCLSHIRMTAFAKSSRFLRRLVHFRHMDFEFAAWQMVYLMVAPQKVYRNFMYRKRTKDQWARDDPAFLVLMSTFLTLSSMLFACVLGLSFFGFIKFLLWVVCIDCIGVGVVLASVLWAVSNNFMRRVQSQDVEWGFCFDVHLNAFFPLLVMLHVIMPLLYPVFIKYHMFLPCLVGNSLWFIAIGYYLYITFLGYTALPILKNTHIFLYPFTFIFIFYVTTLTVGWNISISLMNFYHFRAS